VRASDRHIVFGSFNALTKLNVNAIRVWSRILERVPHSRLLLKAGLLQYPATRSRVLAAFASEGIAAERLELRPWQNTRSGHLQSYDEVDIALDTFPYNGTTTTCEALWIGVPVIGLRGEMHMARVGATLLESAGLPELVADSDDQYVELAVQLAGDLARLAALRSSMREKLSRSRLLDRTTFVRRFEDALRTAWTGWCSRPGPRTELKG
jgi:predicted O-linked N-acetylglucosamine transferase (SPINDLY family)